MAVVEQLCNRICRAIASADVAETVGVLLKERAILSPWVAWTLIGQCRHRNRQRWVTEIVHTRLQRSNAQHGVVPGLIDWEYCFHGKGCRITHRKTGEEIDVDFFDDTGDYVDPYFYIRYLRSLKEPEYAEQRLIALHPSFDPVVLALHELEVWAALKPWEDSLAFKLAPVCEGLCELVDDFMALFDDPSKRFLASVAMGDWPKAEEQLPQLPDAEARLIRRLAAECRQSRIDELIERYEEGIFSPQTLYGLLDIGAPQVVPLLNQILRGDPGPTMCIALQALLTRRDTAFCAEVYQLFLRLDPAQSVPEPLAWLTAAEFLLRTEFNTAEVSNLLFFAMDCETAERALLALEFEPASAPRLFGLALRSTCPHDCAVAAAALAILDEPWGIREMVAVLKESNDQAITSEVRGALVCSGDPNARQAVLDWEAMNPSDIASTGTDVWRRDKWVRHQMARLHDRVFPLRGRVKQ